MKKLLNKLSDIYHSYLPSDTISQLPMTVKQYTLATVVTMQEELFHKKMAREGVTGKAFDKALAARRAEQFQRIKDNDAKKSKAKNAA